MNTGSRDEQMMLANLKRIADSLERLAGLAEQVASTVPAPRQYVTKSGKVLTDADIQALADEAEVGYDVDGFRVEQRR